jgi:restriction-modification enzyme MmeI-like protein
LVLWIGYLQWHFRIRGGIPEQPILRKVQNIEVKDAIVTWTGYPVPPVVDGKKTYPNSKQPTWPRAEFIAGNPPYMAGQDFRRELGDTYSKALWAAYKHISGSADLVMFWWDRAAELLTQKDTVLRRFGLVTTRTITHEFSGRVVARHLNAKAPISLVMAIPNHPWTKATKDTAAVRIAITVGEKGRVDGLLRETIAEDDLETDEPKIAFQDRPGKINSNLSIGVDVTSATKLRATDGMCHDGVKLHGKGFLVRPQDAEHLGLWRREGLNKVIRPYLNGRDINQRSRRFLVIDLFGLSEAEVRRRFPEVYHYLLSKVKPERDKNNRPSRRDNWWLFGENQPKMRNAISGLGRYIGTVDTSRHRIFSFIEEAVLCDDKVVICASRDAFDLGVLSSKIHCTWANKSGVRLGVGNDPVCASNRCFDPFTFPASVRIDKKQGVPTRIVPEGTPGAAVVVAIYRPNHRPSEYCERSVSS